MKDDALPCRVLTRCNIKGVDHLAGDVVDLTEPQRGFLIEHRMIALVDAPTPGKEKQGKDGPAV